MKLRIAIVAHGRFHAFDLARELHAIGHDVTLFSNYPAWAVERFGLSRTCYAGFWIHGAAERVLAHLAPGLAPRVSAAHHRAFGRWAAGALAGRAWDVIHSWSGIAEELLIDNRVRTRCHVLMRGSAHIAEQAALLEDEEARAGVTIERPSDWMIAREAREYARADRILVLSEFARRSFERHGIGGERLSVLPLGVDVGQFRCPAASLEERVTRVRDGGTLRVLFVGALSARKGLRDLVQVARACEGLPIEFTLVGPALPETTALLAGGGPNLQVLGPRDQRTLPDLYCRADVFLFPTIEDGFGMVLAQAAAAGLILLATDHCAAPEIVGGGAPGWILAVHDVQGFAGRLRWCHEHRAETAAMIEAAGTFTARSWNDVASAFAGAASDWVSTTDGPRGAIW